MAELVLVAICIAGAFVLAMRQAPMYNPYFGEYTMGFAVSAR